MSEAPFFYNLFDVHIVKLVLRWLNKTPASNGRSSQKLSPIKPIGAALIEHAPTREKDVVMCCLSREILQR
ncbi:hypothetical protein DPMN_186576 [Dreissena polymorpha]|uniref:Uncharacterized protein n=1 Tax=Dreissena polymorpha TaxID=45954 RepID=A0A9D4DN38_DREPO|nr:hypothetical protein DPMN_186576 [Dreissena polymorpha]